MLLGSRLHRVLPCALGVPNRVLTVVPGRFIPRRQRVGCAPCAWGRFYRGWKICCHSRDIRRPRPLGRAVGTRRGTREVRVVLHSTPGTAPHAWEHVGGRHLVSPV